MQDSEVIETKIESSEEDQGTAIPFDQIGEVIEKIEQSKQITAIKQIEATDKDNERQYKYALKRDEKEHLKWSKSFNVGAWASGTMGIFAMGLIIIGEKDLGVGLLATVIAGVFGFIAGSGSCKK